MPRCVDPAVEATAATFDESAREWFEERAAIIEFEGGIARVEAERQALELTRRWIARRGHGGSDAGA